jgi:hypothetical protein
MSVCVDIEYVFAPATTKRIFVSLITIVQLCVFVCLKLCLIVFGIYVTKYGWSQFYVSIFVYSLCLHVCEYLCVSN